MGRFKLIYLARRNPSIDVGDWPRAWRSHAVYASQFPVLGARIDSLRYCAREAAPMLGGAPFEPAGAARDYDGVAIVSSPSANSLGGDLSAEDRAWIEADELRVFAGHTTDFSFRCAEVLTRGGAPGRAAVIRFLVRKPGTSPKAFQSRWNRRHAQIASRAADADAGVTRYVHDAPIEPPPPGYPFDGIVETWFDRAEDAARSFVDDGFAAVAEDLAAFCDLERSVTLLTNVVHRWPRLSASSGLPDGSALL